MLSKMEQIVVSILSSEEEMSIRDIHRKAIKTFDIDISMSSLYSIINSLIKKELLKVARIERVEGGKEAKFIKITSLGVDAFAEERDLAIKIFRFCI